MKANGKILPRDKFPSSSFFNTYQFFKHGKRAINSRITAMTKQTIPNQSG